MNVALLILRLVTGGLLAGHGAQKLFGSFGGYGLAGTAGWLESLGLRPGRPWAALAGLSEFGGGVLTAVGLLNPIGPLATMGAMLMATFKVHMGKPIWASEGGPELPLINMAAQTTVMLVGPGAYSLDRLLGIRLPRWIALPGLAAVIGAVAVGLRQAPEPPEAVEEDAGAALQSGTGDSPEVSDSALLTMAELTSEYTADNATADTEATTEETLEAWSTARADATEDPRSARNP